MRLALIGMCVTGVRCVPARAPTVLVEPQAPERNVLEPRAVGAISVTAPRVEAYSSTGPEKAVVYTAAFGEKLLLLERSAEWLKIRLPGIEAWVKISEIWPIEQCPSDSNEPVVLEEPIFQFDSPRRGRVVIEAAFDSHAVIQSVRIVENTLGDGKYAEIAENDLRGIRLRPPVRNCRERSFVYTFTRNF